MKSLICIIIIIMILTLIMTYLILNKIDPVTNIFYNDELKDTFKDISTPIDMVYTWVDSTDPKWLDLKQIFEESILNKPDNGTERYTNSVKPDAELELSLELSLQNVPWIRNIYIVTMKPQIPECLVKNPKLHKEYISKRIRIIHHDTLGLPITFNSVAIEGTLHRIPDLSNYFLYMNDDIYILNPCKKGYFFKNNKIVMRYHPYYYKSPTISSYYGNWNILLNYIDNLVINNHGCCWTLSKEIMKEAEKKYPKEWEKNIHSAFRNHEDIQPLGLALNLGIKNKKVVGYSNDPLKINAIHGLNTRLTRAQIKNITKLHIFCLNGPSLLHLLENIYILRCLFVQ